MKSTAPRPRLLWPLLVVLISGLALSTKHPAAATIAVGDSHSCAVVSGGVQCWGSNDSGQLGNPSFGDVSTATPVATLEPNTNAGVSAIAAGIAHTCALVLNGTVKCWGANSHGQLGTGDAVRRSSPASVLNVSNAIGITAGGEHTCALLADGSVECWGWNNFSQLGLGDKIDRTVATPIPTAFLSGVTALSAGGQHTCALLLAGTVKCWGNNDKGQLGLNDTTPREYPSNLFTLSNILDISAGMAHTCAVKDDGTALCWGSNDREQVSSGGYPQLLPGSVTGLANAAKISAGTNQTCAVASGGVKCWGAGDMGQLGNGSFADSPVPKDAIVSNMMPIPSDTEVAAGNNHTCTRYQSTIFCWGSLGHGMIGNSNDNRVRIPTAVALANVTQIAAGSDHTCALLADGKVQCWGYNQHDQIGNAVDQYAIGPTAVPLIPSPGKPNGPALGIAAGSSHTCALYPPATLGDVSCWGDNKKGQAGGSSTDDVPNPRALEYTGGAKAIVAGQSHTCLIAADNTAACWGADESGELGLGNSPTCQGDAYNVGCQLPTSVPGLTNIASITAGGGHTCVVLSDTTVKCWGRNDFGQLGLNDNMNRKAPVSVPGLSGVSAITAGESHTCAILSGGAIKCWGRNDQGQLGLGDTTNRATPTTVDLTDATAISAGGAHTCAIHGNSDVVSCWGSGSSGQLGNGTLDDWYVPHDLPESGATLISAGREHTCAKMALNQVKCWGLKLYGRLGIYSTGLISSPNLVVENDVIFASRFEIKP